MKVCGNCAASNSDSAKFCNECGTALAASGSPPVATVRAKSGFEDPTVRDTSDAVPSTQLDPTRRSVPEDGQFQSVAGDRLGQSMTRRADDLQALQDRRRADIVFVLDTTSSMKGEIDAIKDAIMVFVDSIHSSGVRVRVGLVEFKDRLINEEHRALRFNGEAFTTDADAFRREVSLLQARGGGDEPESSLDALMLALRQPFDADANKVLVLVTDAPPHIPDRDVRSIEEVAQAIRLSGIRQLYLVIRTQDPKSQIYLKLLEETRGIAFELGKGGDFRSRAEDFKRTLMALGKTISSATR